MTESQTNVQSYLENLPLERQEALKAIRSLIRETLPEINETMRYRMPTYEYKQVFVSMASQKHYMSLYLDVSLVEKHKAALKHLDCGKSCVRFKKLEDLPLETIKQILIETVKEQDQ